MFSPYLIFIWRANSWSLPPLSELFMVYTFTFLQAFLSTSLSMVIGVWCALGLCALNYKPGSKILVLLELMLLSPSFLPALFIVISVLTLINPFPFGLWGIVIVNALIFSGYVANAFFAKLNDRLGFMSELALIEGASKLQTLLGLIFPVMKRDILNLFLLVFFLAFNSFSVPLLVGKIGSTSIEILIYQKILIEDKLDQAFSLASLQMILTFIILFLPATAVPIKSRRVSNLTGIGMKSGLFIIFLLFTVCLAGLLLQTPVGVIEIANNLDIIAGLKEKLIVSLTLGLSVGTVTFLGLMTIAYGLPHKLFDRILISYIAPSAVLVSFSFLLLPFRGLLFAPVGIIFCLSILFLPTLYRSLLTDKLMQLKENVEMSYVLSSSWGNTYWHIVFPQISQEIGILSGISAFWAVGDFAVSRMLSSKDITLSMTVEGLLGSYRLASASVLMLGLIVLGIILFLFFKGVGNVLSQKSCTPL